MLAYVMTINSAVAWRVGYKRGAASAGQVELDGAEAALRQPPALGGSARGAVQQQRLLVDRHPHVLAALKVGLRHDQRAVVRHLQAAVAGDGLPVDVVPAVRGNHKLELALPGRQGHARRPHVAGVPLHRHRALAVPRAQRPGAAHHLQAVAKRNLLLHAEDNQLLIPRGHRQLHHLRYRVFLGQRQRGFHRRQHIPRQHLSSLHSGIARGCLAYCLLSASRHNLQRLNPVVDAVDAGDRRLGGDLQHPVAGERRLPAELLPGGHHQLELQRPGRQLRRRHPRALCLLPGHRQRRGGVPVA
mmetsp:Transcript_3184/g.7889  ORF Transcript_3184/g.7889 Transcript_3184/m.7889 type:complete len:301 (-) Transcript_3184:637-1539(-)